MIIKEKLKEITLFETPETDEAKILLKKQKRKFLYWLLLSIGLTILSSILLATAINTQAIWVIVFFYFCALSIPICVGMYLIKIVPYKKLLRIAKHNDRVRNDEHLRFKERLRLENSIKEKQNKQIPQKIQKTKVEDIDKTINEILLKNTKGN